MPEHIRALAWILALTLPMFALIKRSVTAHAVAAVDFDRRRNLWIAITLVAFLSHAFWLYVGATVLLLAWAWRLEWNPLAVFFALVTAVPAVSQEVSGFGLINYLFAIDHIRLLSLLVLLPAFFRILGDREHARWGSSLADWLLLAYIGLQFVLQIRDDSLTNTLRYSAFYPLIDAFLPYYVASRSLTSVRAFRDALAALVIPALVLAPVALFEYLKGWLLYQPLPGAMGVDWALSSSYLLRGDSLRAVGPMGHSIAFGYFFAVALGLMVYGSRQLPTRDRAIGFGLLAIGLIVTFARGAWVGAVVAIVASIGLRRDGARQVVKLLALGAVVMVALAFTPFGAKLVNQLPFIGTVGDDSVDYRARLFEVSWQVVMQNPLFGSVNVLSNPVLEQMRQGEGLIDLVNSYVSVALYSGLVGLALFVGVLLLPLLAVWGSVRRVRLRSPELEALGCTVFGTFLAVMVMIATASSILIVPTIYWSMAGVAVAYTQLVARKSGRELPTMAGTAAAFRPRQSRALARGAR